MDVLEPAPDPVDCRIPQNKNRPGGTPRRGGFFCSYRGRLASIRLSDSGLGTYKRNRPIAPRADFTILLSLPSSRFRATRNIRNGVDKGRRFGRPNRIDPRFGEDPLAVKGGGSVDCFYSTRHV